MYEPNAAAWRMTQAGARGAQVVREHWLAVGLTEEQVDSAIAALEDPRLLVLSQLFMSARGRRPATG